MSTEPIHIVPSVFDDELLSSFWRRVVELNCAQSSRRTTRWLFDAPWRAPDHLLPGYLEQFAQQVGGLAGIPEADCWLERHTLFALFAAGLPPQRQVGFRARMLHAHRGPTAPCLAVVSQETFKQTVALCPRCSQADIERFGVAYWHRLHNGPAVEYCLLHACPLERVHGVDSAAVHAGAVRSRATARRVDNALRFARASAALTHLSRQAAGSFRQQLLDSAARACGDTSNPRIRYAAIAELVCEHYLGGFESVELDSLVRDAKQTQQWLRGLLRPRARVHPIFVALLHGALDAAVAPQRIAQGEHPPKHAKRPIGEDACVEVLRRSGTLTEAGEVLGLAVTVLATIARRHNLSFDSRPSVLGQANREEVCRRLARGDAIRSVAMHAKISIVSVYRVLAASEDTRRARDAVLHAKALERYRARWQRVCASHPGLPPTQTRHKAVGVWTWLYRNDRQWLAGHSQTIGSIKAASRPGTAPPARLPHVQMDRQLRQALSMARTRLLRKPDAARVTRQRLLKAAGLSEDRIHCIATSGLELVVMKHVESQSQFVERRLRYALTCVYERDQSVETWVLIRLARLRPSTIAAVGIDIERWLHSHTRRQRVG